MPAGAFHDICDELKGKYPKDFKFTGWHPHCRCHVETILKTEEEMDADFDRILKGKEPLQGSVNEVRDVPENFSKWIEDNGERIAKAKSTPYFIKDNYKDGDVGKGFKWAKDRNLKSTRKSAQKEVITSEGEKIKYVDKAAKIRHQNRDKKAIVQRWSEEHPLSSISGATNYRELKNRAEWGICKLIGQPFTMKITRADVTLDQAKEMTIQFVKLLSKYNVAQDVPVTELFLRKIKNAFGEHLYWYDGTGVKITISKRRLTVGGAVDSCRSQLMATQKSLCDAENLPISTITHEFGHAITTGSNSKFWDEIKAIRTSYYSEINAGVKTNYLDRYADKTVEEFVAECFQEYVNKKAPSKYAKLVGEAIDKYYLK